MSEKIKAYWDQRAYESKGKLEATTNDVWLRELEVRTIIDVLQDFVDDRGALLADLGCADGYTAVRVAKAFPELRIVGIDISENMIAIAKTRLERESKTDAGLMDRVCFRLGDVTKLAEALGERHYDVVLTDRCLINLESTQTQFNVIRQITEHVARDGVYLAIENFVEGHNAMNAARQSVDLQDIPIRWHNVFFHEAEFVAECGKCFGSLEFQDFSSSYYFATRVIYSALCNRQGVEPDYDHDIHRFAINLPQFGQCSPVRLAILRHPKSA